MPASTLRVRVAALPFDVRPESVEANLRAALDGVDAAAAAGARLLCLPEKWTTSFRPSYDRAARAASEAALAAVHARALARGVVVLGSAPGGGDRRKPANQIHLLGPGGDRRPYAKIMLFSPTGEARQVARGRSLPPTLRVAGVGKVCAVVCYDLRFPEVTRAAMHGGADLLCAPAQWPAARAEVWELMCRARAAENQQWLLSCNRAGRASLGDGRPEMEFPGAALLCDPLGRIAARSAGGEILLAEMDPELAREVRKKVPCARDLRRAGLGTGVADG
jgi:predicted amidohydrolase